MENNGVNEAVLAAHHEAFYLALEQHYRYTDESHTYIRSIAEYDSLAVFLVGPGPKDKNLKRTKEQFVIVHGRPSHPQP